MAEQNPGKLFGGIPAGTTPSPAVNGTFRTYIDGDSARLVDGRWGEQIRFPARVSLGAQGTRGATIFCQHDYSMHGKLVRLLKAINGITGNLPADFDLSTLRMSGDILAEVETNEEGYLNITGFMALPRYENGAVATPDVATTVTDANGRRLIKLDNGRMVDAETGELVADDVPF